MSLFKWYPFKFLLHVVFLVHSTVSEEHITSIFRVQVMRVRILMGYIRLVGGLGQEAHLQELEAGFLLDKMHASF